MIQAIVEAAIKAAAKQLLWSPHLYRYDENIASLAADVALLPNELIRARNYNYLPSSGGRVISTLRAAKMAPR